MTELTLETRAPLSTVTVAPDHASGVSWAAVIAGAFVASAFSLALVALGAGIGLISVSPWSNNNPSVTTFTVLAAAWFIAVELFACGVGGYIAGRLRVGWARVHTDEVYFRDTAHGLLVWAVGAVMTAVLLAWAASSAVSGAAHLAGAATEVVGEAAGAAAGQAASTIADPTAYFADMLFRSDHPAQGDQAGAPGGGWPDSGSRSLRRRSFRPGQDLSRPDRRQPGGNKPAGCGETGRGRVRSGEKRQAAGGGQGQGGGGRRPQDGGLCGPLGLHLAPGRRFLGELHGDRRRSAAGRSAAV